MSNTPEHLTVGVEYFRRNSPGLLAKVEGGNAVVTLTSNNRPVARVVPMTDAYGSPGAFPVSTEQLEKTPDIGLDGERLDFSAKTLDEVAT